MVLQDKDIIQIDATVIAGVLVLLTISSFSSTQIPSRPFLVAMASGVGIPFGLSALSILQGDNLAYARYFEDWFWVNNNIYGNNNSRECNRHFRPCCTIICSNRQLPNSISRNAALFEISRICSRTDGFNIY